jgi:hypothetical protein
VIGGSTPPLLTKNTKNNENYLEISKIFCYICIVKVLKNNDTKIFQKKLK